MFRPVSCLLFLAAITLLSACDGYPRDADAMSHRASASGMRVGASHEPPYLRVAPDGTVTGSDALLMEGFAREHGYRLTWVTDAHDALMRELKDADLHAVVGGHREQSPWTPEVGWSQPFRVREGGDGPLHERRIALPPGQSAWHLAIDRYLLAHPGPQRESGR